MLQDQPFAFCGEFGESSEQVFSMHWIGFQLRAINLE